MLYVDNFVLNSIFYYLFHSFMLLYAILLVFFASFLRFGRVCMGITMEISIFEGFLFRSSVILCFMSTNGYLQFYLYNLYTYLFMKFYLLAKFLCFLLNFISYFRMSHTLIIWFNFDFLPVFVRTFLILLNY